ncbi:MAG TPA: nucleotide sugar dehydrogenase, partial [Thermoleophilaceae bacterium]
MPGSVAVVGLGRVGLPLALSFADRGLQVIGVERRQDVLDRIAAGQMPFEETGTQELLQRALAGGRLETSADARVAARADHIVLTLGTPSYEHIEIDVSQIRGVLDDLLGVLRPGHTLILRSTVAPGTTEWVAGYVEQRRGLRVGEDVFVAHVPERIAANHFLEEIATLPCIVGGVGEGSGARAAEPFELFDTEIVQTTPVQAELAKIWTNILRYAEFALPNLLMMECEQYGANVFDVVDLINRDYPRGGMGRPGLTGGACLRKDFTFSEERSSAPGMLLAVSRVHETVPLFLVDGIKRRLGGSLRDRKVAVLGLAFKRDTDDERDSLAHKLLRLLERELADVAVHDPVVATPTSGFDEAV